MKIDVKNIKDKFPFAFQAWNIIICQFFGISTKFILFFWECTQNLAKSQKPALTQTSSWWWCHFQGMEKVQGKRDLGGGKLACWDHVEFEMSTEHQNGDPDQGLAHHLGLWKILLRALWWDQLSVSLAWRCNLEKDGDRGDYQSLSIKESMQKKMAKGCRKELRAFPPCRACQKKAQETRIPIRERWR